MSLKESFAVVNEALEAECPFSQKMEPKEE